MTPAYMGNRESGFAISSEGVRKTYPTTTLPDINSTHSQLLSPYELRWGIQELPELLQVHQPSWDQLLPITPLQGVYKQASQQAERTRR